MLDILGALIPVFLVIAFGVLVRLRKLFDDGFWDGIERLTFYILFPALLIARIGGAEVPGADLVPLFAALFTATAAVCIVMALLRPGLKWEGGVFVAVLQGAVRSNTYVGLAAATALYGEAGLTLAAVAILAVLPLVNFAGVYAHHRWDGGGTADESATAQAIKASFKNPIIIACLIGAALNLTGLGLPPLVGDALDILGRAALPLGLMAVDTSLNLRALRLAGGPAAASVAIKLLILPAITMVACGLFRVSGVTASVAVLFAALPVSASSYVMTRQMGGEGELMAAIVALSTVLAMVTLPIVVWGLGTP